MKKHKILCMFSLILIGGGVMSIIPTITLTSCTKKSIYVPWRTEDFEGKVNQPVSATREFIWITSPQILGGTWDVYSHGNSLPSGIVLDHKTGQLTGMPTKEGTYKIHFTYSVPGFKVNISNEVTFIIFGENASQVDVDWVGDVPFKHSVNVPLVNGLQIGYSNNSGCKWNVREGWELPQGLVLDENTGKLHGTPSIYGQFEISYECSADGFEKNVSPVYSIIVNLVHTLIFAGKSRNNSTTNNLTTQIASQRSVRYKFLDFVQYLNDNGYTSSHTLTATGNGFKSDGTTAITFTGIYYHYYGTLPVTWFETTATDGFNEWWDQSAVTLNDTIV